MGSGDNSTVAISIMVTDGDSAPVLQNLEARFGALGKAGLATGDAISSTTRSMAGMAGALVQVGTAGTTTAATLTEMGRAAQASLSQVSSGANEAGAAMRGMGAAATEAGAAAEAGMRSTYGSMREVSGTAREMGLSMGYSMRHAIAESAPLMALLQSMSGIFVGLAAIEIGRQMIEGLVELYDKWISVDDALDKYTEGVKQTQQQDVVNVRSIEDAQLRLSQLTEQMVTFREVAEELHNAGLAQLFQGLATGNISGALATLVTAKKMAEDSATAGAQSDAVKQREMEFQHQINLLKIDAAHASDNELDKQQKITAELQKQLDINAENQRFTRQQDMQHGNAATRDSGGQERDLKDSIARQSAAAQRAALGQQEAEQQQQEIDRIRQLQQEADEAHLSGIALIQYREDAALDEVYQRVQRNKISQDQGVAESAAIWEKFEAEKAAETQKQAEEDRKYWAEQEQNAQQFSSQMSQIGARDNSRGLGGYAQIEAEARSLAGAHCR